MMRKISTALLLCLLLAVLSGCAAQQYYDVATQKPVNVVQATPTPAPEGVQGDAGEDLADDAMNEEGLGDASSESSVEAVSSMAYPYAGATPLPLDPIDMPTPTPRPALAFTYETYESTKLGLKFEGPAGWVRDETTEDTFLLSEPAEQQKDGYTAFISLRKAPVNKDYSKSDMINEVEDILDGLGDTNYVDFRPSNTAERTLIGHDGIYADYQGTLIGGIRVRGRVHITCIDKTLYILHLSHPAGYNTDYLKNHGKLRETLALTK